MQYPAKMNSTGSSNNRPAKNKGSTDISETIAYRINLFYVGGHQKTVLRLRTLVKAWNGRIFDHDGGLERSIDELVSAAVKADAVVFPADCISLSAAKNKPTLQETTE
jgi:hypothetical protein